MFENRILTWDNYVRMGGLGSSCCLLCFEEVETMDHLIVQCVFSRSMWEDLRCIIGFPLVWGSLNLTNTLDR